MTAAFHLYNQESKHKFKVHNTKILPFCPSTPVLKSNRTDQLLYYHLEALPKNVSACILLLTQLAKSGWGARAKTPYAQLPYL